MEKRWVLILSLVLGFMSVILLFSYMQERERRIRQEMLDALGQKMQVVVAKTIIPKGATIEDSMLDYQTIPQRFVQPQVYQRSGDLVKMIALLTIQPGEQITRSKVDYPWGALISIGEKIPPGQRAWTLSTTRIAGTERVSPDDRVDIMGTFTFPIEEGGKEVSKQVTATLFQNVLVVEVGGKIMQTPGVDTGGLLQPPGQLAPSLAHTITFSLTPEEIEILTAALEIGKLQVVARSKKDLEITPIPAVTANDILRHFMPEKARPPTKNVEVIRGDRKEKISVPLKLPEVAKEAK
jgi:pilus assembly protein CpaB